MHGTGSALVRFAWLLVIRVMFDESESYQSAIAGFERCVEKGDDGLLKFSANDSDLYGVRAVAYNDFKRSLEATNNKIKLGEIMIEDVVLGSF